MTHAVQSIPWGEVVAFYEKTVPARGNAFKPMTEFVRFVGFSRYANGMFATISAETLCIGRTPNFVSGKDELRIDFDETQQVFTFTHIKNPDEKYPWSLSCLTNEWQATFERLVHKRLRWFHEG